MTLPRALVLALGMHAALLAAPLPGLDAPAPDAAARAPMLLLHLVQPTQTLGESTDAPGAARADGRRGDSSGSASAAAPGRASADLDSIAAELGLDLADVSEPLLDRIYPVMLKIHLRDGQPTASNYRQLLRTYIDVTMGYPWAVEEQLARNGDVRFLARFEVEVAGDGTLRLDSLLMNASVLDPDGRLLAFYERALRSATARPFLPPSRAGLPAPLRLSFQLLNPEARIW